MLARTDVLKGAEASVKGVAFAEADTNLMGREVVSLIESYLEYAKENDRYEVRYKDGTRPYDVISKVTLTKDDVFIVEAVDNKEFYVPMNYLWSEITFDIFITSPSLVGLIQKVSSLKDKDALYEFFLDNQVFAPEWYYDNHMPVTNVSFVLEK